MVAYIAVVCRW